MLYEYQDLDRIAERMNVLAKKIAGAEIGESVPERQELAALMTERDRRHAIAERMHISTAFQAASAAEYIAAQMRQNDAWPNPAVAAIFARLRAFLDENAADYEQSLVA